MAARKRTRPPNLTLRTDAARPMLPTITLDSPLHSAEDDIVQLSPPSSSSSTCLALSPSNDFVLDTDSDELSKDMAVLAKLRESVQKNLRLRPIRSFSVIPKSHSSSGREGSALPTWSQQPQRRSSSSSSTASSVYYTPDDDGPPDTQPDSRRSPPPSVLAASAWDPGILYDRLTASKRPILIDTRPLAAYQGCHILDGINIAIPSLILKRCRKPGGGFQNIDTLRQFITSDQDKHQWDSQSSPEGCWDGDIVIIYGEETDESEKDNMQVAAWALLEVLSTLLGPGRVHYLRGGISAAQHHPLLRRRVVYQVPKSADAVTAKKIAKGRGLFHLNTAAPTQSNFPEIEQPTLSPIQVSPSDLSRKDLEATGSPAPSHLTFRRPRPPRRPSAPNLRCNTTDAGEQHLTLPRLQIRTVPMRSATLPITPTFPSANPKSNPLYLSPQSPSHLNLLHSNHSPPASSPRWTTSPTEFLQPPSPMVSSHTPPRTPSTPSPLSVSVTPSPQTVRPDDQEQATLTEELPSFTVSMILPNFLYLGPELTLPEHVEELKALGIKRILNIAAECDDDQGLRLREEFEKYVKIPMRDTVEEDKITKGLKEACEVLDEASLYGASTYVHCKVGKSRSVTAVMAYLIHANHWTLSRAYSFVLERRKGISPNIGFVSELMTFEEQELGGKSVGVMPITPGHSDGGIGMGRDGGDVQANHAYAGQSRRTGHARESLPPMFTIQEPDDGSPATVKAGEVTMGQDMEVKDSEGRYRHVRRAPVDENTLQPMRRVSKAGLESAYS
ncbi:hypothetical protein F5I97DRAFT_1912354 [Phlebopus sp. FC_14]|nr:hypothetical protein F5I97DRAFT_1912354 [Phlebopus sp. FC_14]